MVIRKLSAQQIVVRDELLRSQTIPATARALGMKERKIRTIANQLECLREIRRDPASVYPILYISPGPAMENREITRGTATSNQGCADGARPQELSRIHLNGMIYYKVRNVGKMVTLRDMHGYSIGDWISQGKPCGSVEYEGFVRMGNKDIKFFYREGGKGSRTLTVYPADTMETAPGAMNKGEKVLRDRAAYVTELLYEHDWRFHDQEVRGTFEAGHVDHPFMSRMDREHVSTGATVKLDTSPKVPEVEVSSEEANDILSYAPEHIKHLYGTDNDLMVRFSAIESRLDAADRIQVKLIRLNENNILILGQQAELNDIIVREYIPPSHPVDALTPANKVMYR